MSDFLTYCLVYVLAVVLIFWLIIGGASFWFFCLCRRYYNPNLSPFHPQHPRNLLTHTGTSRSFESSTLHVWIRFCQHVKSINKTSKKLWWQQRFLAFYSNFGHIYGNLRTILKCLKYQKRTLEVHDFTSVFSILSKIELEGASTYVRKNGSSSSWNNSCHLCSIFCDGGDHFQLFGDLWTHVLLWIWNLRMEYWRERSSVNSKESEDFDV